MTRNPLALVAIAVAVGLVTVGAIALFSSGWKQTSFQPLKPHPGEQLRLQPPAPKPEPADAAEIAHRIEGKTLMPGDAVLADALKSAVAAGQTPTFKASVDVPLGDNAAPAVRDEVKGWLAKKMAALGYKDTGDKPTVSWIVHIDPLDGGRYSVETIVRAGGMERFRQKLELPHAWAADRVEKAMAPAFAPAAP
jgi:hypothetical protein